MTKECPSNLFNIFEASTGNWIRPEGDGAQFLYDALGDDMGFTGVTSFTIPILDDEAFGNWEKFEYWCEDIKPKLMWKVVDYESVYFQSAYENSTPKKYFKTKSAVKAKIIDALSDGAAEDVESIMYVEIKCGKKKLYLVYFDSDSWALGHGDSVLVVKSLSQLNKKNGYYPLR
jgi:hypothetical protein